MDLHADKDVSGVSRSGRVRKKSAKVMEMEDFDSEFMQDTQRTKKKTPKHLETFLEKSINRKITPIKITTNLKSPTSSIQKRPHDSIMERPPLFSKNMSSLVALPASGYLAEDDSFMHTEEIAAGDHELDDDPANDEEELLSPLKIDIGEEPSIAIREESSLKMKFILSPKLKSTSEGKSSKSSSKKSEKKSKQLNLGEVPKKKKKKKPPPQPSPVVDSVSTLNVLASGGSVLTDDFDEEEFLRSAQGAGELTIAVDDVEEESKLVIEEMPRIVSKPKKKKSSSKPKSSSQLQVKIGGGKSHKSKSSKVKSTLSTDKFEEFEPSFGAGTDQSDLSTFDMVTGTQAQSVYMKEKKTLKKKSSKKATKSKDKSSSGKSEQKSRPITAYMLWCREYRKRIVQENPSMDFATISRRLGEGWQTLSEKDKLNWRRKALKLANKTGNLINTGKQAEGSKSKLLNKSSSVQGEFQPTSFHFTTPGTSPIDVAAYLKLLGESLSTIGQRLTEHEGQIAVSGSLSVLLDSTLCALGPLICLSSQVPQLNGCGKGMLEEIIDNIVYIMPGL